MTSNSSQDVFVTAGRWAGLPTAASTPPGKSRARTFVPYVLRNRGLCFPIEEVAVNWTRKGHGELVVISAPLPHELIGVPVDTGIVCNNDCHKTGVVRR